MHHHTASTRLAASCLAAVSLAAQNPIVVENQNPGVPSSVWYVPHPGDANIQGFATDISVNRGDTVHFKILTAATAYHIDVYRLGWYQGNGARLVGTGTITAMLPQSQPTPLHDPVTGLTDCGNWAESAHWVVPATAVSGVHLAKLTRDDGTPGTSVITFVVRDDASTSDILMQTSDATWQAYNVYGGMSLYPAINGGPPGFNHATKVSYNRPFDIRHADGAPGDDVFAAEYPMIRFLEANGYDVSYTTCVDSDRRGNLIQQHGLFVSCGHDEYWSGPQRTNVTQARDAGVHLAFFSGNEVYWKVRYEPSIDGTSTSHRTLVCYKEGSLGENGCGTKCDPSPQWTGLWRDGCPPTYVGTDACAPENPLTGQIGWDGSIGAIQVPFAYKDLRFWRNTGVASLSSGQTATLGQQSLGSEWDWEQFAASYPPRRIKLSSTLLNGRLHHLSLYRADSGALVFGAGTIQWSWGLDAFHTFAQVPTNADMRQATVNLLADMGIAPGSLQAGLVPATGSSDTQAPASIIASPTSGSSSSLNNAVLVQGIASDTGGGVVAGVEVSFDSGLTWRAATGTTTWSYLWSPTGVGTFTIESRAFDDTGNLEPAGGTGSPNVVTIDVTPAVCPCTTFPSSLGPTVAGNDGQPIGLGMKFRTESNGWITALRYYKPAGTPGTRIGSLWTSSGVNLAQQAFTADTASGWQEIALPAPVPVTANTTYVVSYFSPSGDYVATLNWFTQETGPGPVHGLGNGQDGPNGVYTYAAAPAFPTQSFQASNYFADVVFDTSLVDTVPPTVTSRAPAPNATGVAPSTTIQVTFSEAIDPLTVTTGSIELRDALAAVVPATVSYDAFAHQATLVPSASLAAAATYTTTVHGGTSGPRIRDLAGNALAADAVWSFTTAAAAAATFTVFTPTTVPAGALANDQSPIVLGMRFRADVDGFVTALRYFKPTGATGAHTGQLWSSGGTLLAQQAFGSETASGWQQTTLATPVPITANTTLVVSYHSPSGDYVGDGSYFTQTVGNNLVHGLANGLDGANGVYAYAAAPVFPSQTFNAANYWADVVFQPAVADLTPPAVTAHLPAAAATGVATNTVVTVTFDEALDPGTVTLATIELRDPGNTLVPATVVYAPVAHTATLSPTATLAALTTYTVRVRGGTTAPRIEDASDNGLVADVVWSFTTGVLPQGPFTVFAPSSGPTGSSFNDASPIVVGMKFRADVDGVVTALRYYKAAGIGGARTGNLWATNGAMLAQQVFTGETASGWQEIALTTPVPVSAGTTYVVSCFSSSGDYVATGNWFTAASGAGLVHGLADGTDGPNGVYLYNGAPAFPTDTFNKGNYWVDVVFGRNYTLAASTAGNGTVAKSPDLASYAPASSVQLTATPAAGHTFTGWSGDASGATNPLTVVMTGDKVITANFAPIVLTHTLSTTTSGNGTVARAPDLPAYAHGATVMVTATPSFGWVFSGWSGDASGTTNPLSIVINADAMVTANFVLDTYTLATGTTGSGTVTKSPDLPDYAHGTTVQLTATPGVGWLFTGWSGDAAGTANPLSVLMTADKSITANFVLDTHALGITTVGSGTVAKSPDLADYPHGTSVQLTATPAAGFVFTGWGGDGAGTANPLVLLMDGDKNVTATFVSGAGHEAYGNGCYDIDRASFYQLFPTAAAASAALTGQSMVLTPNANGYTVQWGGGVYQPPSGLAVSLPANDDGETSVQPSLPLPIPGGSAATLHVHTNGVVSTGTGNGTLLATAPPGPSFLDAPDTAWWSWHDFDTTQPGSGTIRREEVTIGAHTVLCITWLDVESRAVPEAANPSTVQLQFDLTSGAVTFVWVNVTPVGTGLDPQHPESTLVGYSPGGPSIDPGPVVLASVLPIVTQRILPMALEASPAPVILGSGSTQPMTWTIHELPDAVPPQGIRLGIVFFSVGSAPGVDLDVIGAPGCDLYLASLDVPLVILTTAGSSPTQSVQVTFPPPLQPGLSFWSQAFGFFPPNSLPTGQNPLGMATSNGVRTTF